MLKLNSKTVVSAGFAVALLFGSVSALGASVGELQNQLDTQNNKINGIADQVNQKQQVANTLQNQIDAMNQRIDGMRADIANTDTQIAALNTQIAAVQAKMAAKQAMLKGYLRDDYYSSNSSTLEVLVGSKNLSDFVDQSQYLESAQNKINDLLAEVVAIKKQLDGQKSQLDTLKAKQEDDKKTLDAQVAIQNDLLAKTRGEEANYQAMLENEQAAAARLSSTISKLMGNGPQVSHGYVVRGQVIGHEGSTGFSTGPHLHFGTYVNQQAVNPHQYLNSGRAGYPEQDYIISQDFGPANWSNSHYSFHDGIDMAGPYGEPIQAACNGNIIINSFQPGGFGHYIVIDCGGGLWTLYGHMQ